MKAPTKHVSPYLAGCTVRRHGKLYAVTETDNYDKDYALSYQVLCPPHYIGTEEVMWSWGVSAQGVGFYKVNGILHLLSCIGADNYPNVADTLEEWLNGWASTLLPQNDPRLRQLTPGPNGSRILFFHSRGHLTDFKTYRENFLQTRRPECLLPDDEEHKAQRQRHLDGDEMCAGLHWQHVLKGMNSQKKDVDPTRRYVDRTIGELTYRAVGPINHKEIPPAEYAIVAWRPIDRFDIVDNEAIDDKSEVEKALEFLLGQGAIPMPVFRTDH